MGLVTHRRGAEKRRGAPHVIDLAADHTSIAVTPGGQVPWQGRVKMRRAHSEHMSSGFLPTADIVQRDRHFAFGPKADSRNATKPDRAFAR